MYEHRYLENIKKLEKYADECDNQQQYIYNWIRHGIQSLGNHQKNSNGCGNIVHSEEANHKKVT